MEYDQEIWDQFGYTHTNECETVDDCYYNSLRMHGCNDPRLFYSRFLFMTKYHCTPMGNQGKKYCTLGCKLFAPTFCSDPNAYYDQENGSTFLCHFYLDNVTQEVVPDCPCFRQRCGSFPSCADHPTLFDNVPPENVTRIDRLIDVDGSRYVDTSLLGDQGNPVIWRGGLHTTPPYNATRYINRGRRGLRNFDIEESSENESTESAHSIELADDSVGSLVLFQRDLTEQQECTGNMCIHWGTAFTNGQSKGQSRNMPAWSGGDDKEVTDMQLRLTSLTALPIHTCVKDKVLCVRVNEFQNGTGDWSEHFVRQNDNANENSAFVSFEVLVNDGYGMYYRYRNKVGNSYHYEWTFAYTTDTDGETGWNHVIFFTLIDDTSDRSGVLGVDGLGLPYVAYTEQSNVIQIYATDDESGATNWASEGTITLPTSCTYARPDIDRAVLFNMTEANYTGIYENITETDEEETWWHLEEIVNYTHTYFPSILIMCQDGALYVATSDDPSAAEGPWDVQEILESGAEVDSNAMSLLVNGNNKPHVAYTVYNPSPSPEGSWDLHYIQSFEELSF